MLNRESILLSLLLFANSANAIGSDNLELKCLADTIYHEGRSLDIKEQMMIGKVVLNRLNNPKFPKSICSVVYQKAKGKNGRSVRQFSWTANGNKINEPEAYKKILSLAKRLIDENPNVEGFNNGALFFSKPVKKFCHSGKVCHKFK